MKTRRMISDGIRETAPARAVSSPGSRLSRHLHGFTMIEIMVVAAIMVLILAMGIPSIYQMTTKKGMRRAVSDVLETCAHARAHAIMRGQQVDLVFYPEEKRFEVMGTAVQKQANEEYISTGSPLQPISGLSGIIPEDVTIEELWVNEVQRTSLTQTTVGSLVRFFPNGTCDELKLVLRSNQGESRKITLEVTTGLAMQGDVR